MEGRRKFIKKIAGLFSGITILSGFSSPALRHLLGAGRMDEKSLEEKSWRYLVHKYGLTPLHSFGIMGKSNIKVMIDQWRLQLRDKEGTITEYTYDDILKLPPIERKITLVCPGFFDNHGLWKGFSLGGIIREKGLDKSAEKVRISGLNGEKDKAAEFPLDRVLDDRVFLAYEVNRKTLPEKHGFPLRVVAGHYMGSNWVKYVNKITLE